MRPHRKTLLWQVLPLAVLILISQLGQAAKKSPSKKRKCENTRKSACNDCILVKFPNKTSDGDSHLFHIMNLESRSIAPWKYEPNYSSETLPTTLPKITCSTKCVGFENELNAVPIEREIVYLKKENGIYVLHTKTVTVGCTCVHPIIVDRKD